MVSGIVHDNANTCNEEQKLRWGGGNSQDKENSRGVGGGVKASAGGEQVIIV